MSSKFKFFEKFKRRLKPSETGSAGTEEVPNHSAQATLSPASSEPSSSEPSSKPVLPIQSAPSTSVLPAYDEIPHDQKPVQKDPPLNIWQDAFNQLDTDKQNLLMLGLGKEEKDHDKDMTSAKIELALQSVIETVQQQHEIRTLKNDNKVHKAASEILSAASSLREVIGAAVACDPTGHASTAWTVISLGLKVR